MPDVDRVATRLLVSTIGLFPVGTTLKLSNGCTAIVVDVPDPDHLTQPTVMIIADERGAPVGRQLVDLAQTSVTIAGTVDPVELDLNVGHFLFA
jgi:hypothetical protein